MNTTPKTARKSRRQCQSPQCRGRNGWHNRAEYRVGSDGFGAETGKLVCGNYACTSWATKGYPVTLHAV